MNTLLKQNAVKNVILLILLYWLWQYVLEMQSVLLSLDKATVGDITVVVSIIIVTACFGNFAFTYEVVAPTRKSYLLAHMTTGLLMLVIGLCLEMTSILVRTLVGQDLFLISMSLVLLYAACICYDFWDVERLMKTKR